MRVTPPCLLKTALPIGDRRPDDLTGFAMFGPSPHSAWKTDDLDAEIGLLWGEKDEKRPIDGWKAVDVYRRTGLCHSLLQYVLPIFYKSDLKVTPNMSGALQPTLVSPAT